MEQSGLPPDRIKVKSGIKKGQKSVALVTDNTNASLGPIVIGCCEADIW
jgi:hypothetical protein